MIGGAADDRRRSATASAATWRCWSCRTSSSAPGAAAPRPFWPTATARVRERVPGFRFMAEVYWDLEWTMHQQGFDYAYDKRLYDRLRGRRRPAGARAPARRPRLPGQARPLPREPRRAARRRDLPARRARGRRRHHVPVAGPAVLPPGPVRGPASAHLAAPRPRRPTSRSTRRCAASTSACSPCSADRPLRDGEWRLLECAPAWDGNGTSDCFIAWSWRGPRRRAAAGRRQLLAGPEPVLRPSALRGHRRSSGSAA